MAYRFLHVTIGALRDYLFILLGHLDGIRHLPSVEGEGLGSSNRSEQVKGP